MTGFDDRVSEVKCLIPCPRTTLPEIGQVGPPLPFPETSSSQADTISAFAALKKRPSSTWLTRRDRSCNCSHSVRLFVDAPPVKSSFVPGLITMEERYINLLVVLNEASAKFPDESQAGASVSSEPVKG